MRAPKVNAVHNELWSNSVNQVVKRKIPLKDISLNDKKSQARISLCF